MEADVLIVDAPPGTGEELQVIARELPLSGALFVTTPQDLAQMDAERTLSLIEEHEVPIIGLVKNIASMTCPHCNQRIDMFAESARLTDAGLPILGEIPSSQDPLCANLIRSISPGGAWREPQTSRRPKPRAVLAVVEVARLGQHCRRTSPSCELSLTRQLDKMLLSVRD